MPDAITSKAESRSHTHLLEKSVCLEEKKEKEVDEKRRNESIRRGGWKGFGGELELQKGSYEKLNALCVAMKCLANTVMVYIMPSRVNSNLCQVC